MIDTTAAITEAVKKWNIVLDKDITFNINNVLNLSLNTKYVAIDGDKMTIHAGYAWNGIESNYFKDSAVLESVIGLLEIFDKAMVSSNLPHLWQVTLVFDAFYQYASKGELPAKAMEIASAIIGAILTEHGVNPIFIRVIVYAIEHFGPMLITGEIGGSKLVKVDVSVTK